MEAIGRISCDDLASAVDLLISSKIPNDVLNVGSGVEISIAELVRSIQVVIGYRIQNFYQNIQMVHTEKAQFRQNWGVGMKPISNYRMD